MLLVRGACAPKTIQVDYQTQRVIVGINVYNPTAITNSMCTMCRG